jgi:hypothetical protein
MRLISFENFKGNWLYFGKKKACKKAKTNNRSRKKPNGLFKIIDDLHNDIQPR